MTTIAFDGVNLAADKASWSGGVMRKVRKVFKLYLHDGGELALVALSGPQDFCYLVRNWLECGGEPPRFDEHRDDGGGKSIIAAVVITRKPNGNPRIRTLSSNLIYQDYEETFFATGGGHEFAWGALEAGATAYRAVEIAAARSHYSGLGVDVVNFIHEVVGEI